MTKLLYCFLATALALFTSLSNADESATGTISGVDAVGSASGAPNNADIRVYLTGAPKLCTGATDTSWAWFNVTDANYRGLLATVMLAYATGKTITLNTRATSLAGGVYCQITWVNLRG